MAQTMYRVPGLLFYFVSLNMTWRPKSIVCLRYYDSRRFRSDLVAALVLALQVFPVVLSIAIACGLQPHYGIYCAAITAFLAAAFGDSKIGVSAPNVIFLAIASSIVARQGVLGLSLSTSLAGLLLVFFGAIGFGAAIRMLPRSVALGFSTGIAVLILNRQIRDLLGATPQVLPTYVSGQMPQMLRHAPQAEPLAMIVGIGTLVTIVVCRKKLTHAPAAFVAMIVGALLVKYEHFPVQTTAMIEATHLTFLHLGSPGVLGADLVGSILGQGFAIAVLVSTESFQAMRLAGSLTGEDINPNRELLVQGGVNIAAALTGGLPASGISSFTGANANAGAQTPLAGMMQALLLLALLLPITPLVPFIPAPVISGILVASVCAMANWREIPALVKGRRLELGAWLVTSLFTVVTDLLTAIAAGMLIALFLYTRQQRISANQHLARPT